MKKSTTQYISPRITLLDLVSTYPVTEAVIRSYDVQAKECLLCNNLFDPLEVVAREKNLNLSALMRQLRQAIATENS